MKIMTEETFGPTLPIMKVRDSEEAIRPRQRPSPYGLGLLGVPLATKKTDRGEQVRPAP